MITFILPVIIALFCRMSITAFILFNIFCLPLEIIFSCIFNYYHTILKDDFQQSQARRIGVILYSDD